MCKQAGSKQAYYIRHVLKRCFFHKQHESRSSGIISPKEFIMLMSSLHTYVRNVPSFKLEIYAINLLIGKLDQDLVFCLHLYPHPSFLALSISTQILMDLKIIYFILLVLNKHLAFKNFLFNTNICAICLQYLCLLKVGRSL